MAEPDPPMRDEPKSIQIWKTKKLIQTLEAVRGNGATLISIIMPGGSPIALITRKLYEYSSNVVNIVNREFYWAAIASALERLDRYNRVPPNGLVLYTGTIVTDDGQEKNVTIHFEPFAPIESVIGQEKTLSLRSSRFDTDTLHLLLEYEETFGFIVMDGNGIALFGTLNGDTRNVLNEFSVESLKKRLNYVRKTAECATQYFCTKYYFRTQYFIRKIIVDGLILAGPADFKTDLSQPGLFHPRLKAKILAVLDVSCGGEDGFDEAIELSSQILANRKFGKEKRLIGKYFDLISQGTGKCVFGVDDTLKALEMGAVETLIVSEDLDMTRYIMRNSTSEEIVIKHLNKEQEANEINYRDERTGAKLDVENTMSLIEWLVSEYRNFGCTLEIVTDKSQEGYTFSRGFDGIGGILRCQLV